MVTKLDAIKRRRLQLSPELIWRTMPDGSTTDVSEEPSQTAKDLDILLAVAEAAAALIDEGAPSRTHEYAGLECVYCGAVWYARGIEHKADCLWLLAKAALAPLMQEEGE